MSTIVAQTLSNGTVSTSTANCIQGSAKAWVNFNGTPTSGSATIRASYNVSSVTINGTGDYTVNFTNAFSDANYSVSSAGGGGTTSLNCVIVPISLQAPTTTTLRIQNVFANGSLQTAAYVSVSVFR